MVSSEESDSSIVEKIIEKPQEKKVTKGRKPAAKPSEKKAANEPKPKAKTQKEKQKPQPEVAQQENDSEDESEGEDSVPERAEEEIPPAVDAAPGDLSRSLLHQPTPRMIDLMCKAIETIGDKKGATVQAIKKWILGKYPETNVNRMKYMMQKAVERGLENGMLVRPKASAASKGLSGRLMVQKEGKLVITKKPSKAVRGKAKKADDEKENAEETETETVKPKPKAAEKKKPAAKKAPKPKGKSTDSGEPGEVLAKKSAPKVVAAAPKEDSEDDTPPQKQKAAPKEKTTRRGKDKATIPEVVEAMDKVKVTEVKTTRGTRKQPLANNNK